MEEEQKNPRLLDIFKLPCAKRVELHYAGARAHLINSSDILRQSSQEQQLYEKYHSAGEPYGPCIYSSKGEHFTEVAPKLKKLVENIKFDLKYFGYMEYAYGLEEHRQIMKTIILRDHQLTDYINTVPIEYHFEVGCFMDSTRLCMYDLGRLIVQECKDRKPYVLSFEPGWDYAGVYESLNMEVLHLPITHKTEFVPDLNEWTKYLDKQKVKHLDLVIINTQHNPTGKQWTSDVVNYLIDLALKYHSYLLIDDAYYCVNDPRIPVVNTVKLWLERLKYIQFKDEMFNRWIQTRPFGKQFNCNAMGVAAVTASPTLMSRLNHIYWDHHYINGCLNAEIMCQWLKDHLHDADEFIVENCLELTRKKKIIREFMEKELGYPSNAICTGPSTSYLLFQAPTVYQQDKEKENKSISDITEDFSNSLFYSTGVMLSGKLFSHSDVSPFVRLHLGSDCDNLEEILRRFKQAGLNYQMKEKFPGEKGLKKNVKINK
ncbi:unnamed protein product [Didymodactylos carnosus]|uniref:Aminotransferase class I/classII large domain-containing protein n=1 Tax=Didymodactylos carnosus TaxID=1234261 RepID=A0A8S2FJI6_9BILA|nr:unnamed protein product [Didymodactylos carnosus]CAF4279028.1 unnamed protein product [Didymodactylos carnosus]